MIGKLKRVIKNFLDKFKVDDDVLTYRLWIFEIWLYTRIEREIYINHWDIDRSKAHYLVLDSPWFRFWIWKLGEKR